MKIEIRGYLPGGKRFDLELREVSSPGKRDDQWEIRPKWYKDSDLDWRFQIDKVDLVKLGRVSEAPRDPRLVRP